MDMIPTFTVHDWDVVVNGSLGFTFSKRIFRSDYRNEVHEKNGQRTSLNGILPLTLISGKVIERESE